MSTSAKLVLADGSIYAGTAYAATGTAYGHITFDTTMSGYQHSLTNPSNINTVMMFTFPHIGNVGVNDADAESDKYWPSAVVIAEPSRVRSNWQSERPLEDDLKAANVVGISKVDTRAITRHIVGKDVLVAGVFSGPDAELSDAELIAKVKSWQMPETPAQLQAVTATSPSVHTAEKAHSHVALVDLGVRRSTLQQLVARGSTVTVLPANATVEQIVDLKVDGVVLSSGPGNPAEATEQVALVEALIAQNIPVLGIGLGHQIIGLALGYTTVRLKQAHRGPNQPVFDAKSGQSLITTQNHEYALEAPHGTNAAPKASYGNITVDQYNLNDQSVEAFRAQNVPLIGVQYYPESSAVGVKEAHPVFDTFAQMMASGK